MYENIMNLARRAGEIMMTARACEESLTEKTSNSDIVTEYDVKIQNFLFEELSKLYPNAEFVGEEGDNGEILEKIGREAFIIDPIDGTTNFVRNLRKSAVSIAYAVGGKVVFGCVYVPYCDEMFSAELGKGAFLNGNKISCGDRPIEHSLVAFGTAPYYKNEVGDATFDVMKMFYKKAMDVRRVGCATIDITDVACGRCDIFVEFRLSPWDFAAASLIATEAGAIVSKMSGEPIEYDKKISFVTASPRCYDFYKNCEEIRKYRHLF